MFSFFLGFVFQVFRIITSNFADVDPGLLASLHDTPWTMIKLAHTARKQGLTEVCLNSLSKLYSVATMDVQVRWCGAAKIDAFFFCVLVQH